MSVYCKLFAVCLLMWLAGCSERPRVQQYVVPSDVDKVVTSEVLRSQFPVIPFRWKVPEQWRSASNDQFSVVAWSAGPASSPDEARITLSELPGTAGIEPQVLRWRGQIGLPEQEPSEALRSVETLQLGARAGSWIELRGETETILGLIVADADKLWVLKYRSTNATAEQQRSVFRGFCESLTLEKSGRS